jgi:hypothetical protein
MQVGRANRNSGLVLLLFIIAALIVAMIWFWLAPSRKGAEPVSKPLHSEKSRRRKISCTVSMIRTGIVDVVLAKGETHEVHGVAEARPTPGAENRTGPG